MNNRAWNMNTVCSLSEIFQSKLDKTVLHIFLHIYKGDTIVKATGIT